MAISSLSPQGIGRSISSKVQNVKDASKSKSAFHKFLQTRDSESSGTWSWMNEDLLPTPNEKRTWRAWNYIFFYSSLAMDNWTLGSALVGVGLVWWQAIIVGNWETSAFFLLRNPSFSCHILKRLFNRS